MTSFPCYPWWLWHVILRQPPEGLMCSPTIFPVFDAHRQSQDTLLDHQGTDDERRFHDVLESQTLGPLEGADFVARSLAALVSA